MLPLGYLSNSNTPFKDSKLPYDMLIWEDDLSETLTVRTALKQLFAAFWPFLVFSKISHV